MRHIWCAVLCLGLLAGAVQGESLRIATYNVDLSRRGPGLMLRDIERGEALIAEVVATIAAAAPDVVLLTGFDYDHEGVALAAFEALLARAGAPYPHRFARRPNTGLATGLDMNGDGRAGDPADAQGYGRFAGADGMAILSRLPVLTSQAVDFSAFLWRDLPGAVLPQANGRPFPSDAALAVQRLSTTAHWDVPVALPGGGVLRLLAFYATPPVFDGTEDRNGLRNAAEVDFWRAYLDGALLWPAPEKPFVILGDANLDPEDGDGRGTAMRALLADPRLQDPLPASAQGRAAQGPGSPQRGDPALDTADWPGEGDAAGPGNLRVDYVLPSRGLQVLGAAVVWPAPAAMPPPENGAPVATRHGLVWVDIAVP